MKLIIDAKNQKNHRIEESLARMFEAARYSAELFLHPKKRPVLPEQFQWQDSRPLPTIQLLDDAVLYDTVSGAGSYIWRPDEFHFDGLRRSLIDGCLMCSVALIGPLDDSPVTPKNVTRVDITMFAPIGRAGLALDLYEFDYFEIISTMPYLPFKI